MSNDNPKEGKTPQEHISEALDMMVAAGWVRSHARSTQHGIAIDWTDDGRKKIEFVWALICELGPENMTQERWWAVGTIANMKFGGP